MSDVYETVLRSGEMFVIYFFFKIVWFLIIFLKKYLEKERLDRRKYVKWDVELLSFELCFFFNCNVEVLIF